ncbi:histone H3 [Giardia duodenalis assemblage B]|uniref:Histone H3 n=3 Tax=Giardia intestinalis TaxID=5741 RepID=A0A132NQ58_GIAIN|nr:Histone H3 [Giardia intestinalis ATCC 50581]ESU43921.1 Histone H3 [Giardia intestinalis]KWX12181.1 histone H3 [Giardia intestinalis assemblage B]
MARTKNTAMDRSKNVHVTTARKGQHAPRKTILSKKTVARKAMSKPEKAVTRRARPGSQVRKEINTMQRRVTSVIPIACFQRLVRDITCSLPSGGNEIRFQAQAISALQEASEAMLSQVLGDCQILANHAHRVTIMGKDIQIYMRIVRPPWMNNIQASML